MSSSSSSSSTTTTLSTTLDHHHLISTTSSDQLCYVHCNICDTVLVVSVPYTSLFKSTVTVTCGHCTNVLPVNMRGALLLPASPDHHQLHHHFGTHTFFSPAAAASHNFLDQISIPTPNFLMNHHQPTASHDFTFPPQMGFSSDLPRPPVMTRTPEKRQRIPSAYNRFIKEEIQRIKAANPDISHREAFSAAAKNWAHFPHIQFGLMPDPTVKKTNVRQQEAEDVLMKDGFFATANLGVSPY